MALLNLRGNDLVLDRGDGEESEESDEEGGSLSSLVIVQPERGISP